MVTVTQPTMPQQGDPTAQILLELGKISVTLAVMQKTLEAIPDHESRIRKLEQWRYGLPLSGLLAIGSAALSIYSVAHH